MFVLVQALRLCLLSLEYYAETLTTRKRAQRAPSDLPVRDDAERSSAKLLRLHSSPDLPPRYTSPDDIFPLDIFQTSTICPEVRERPQGSSAHE